MTVCGQLTDAFLTIIKFNVLAAQPMWPENQELSKISSALGCPSGRGQLDCLRTKSGDELRATLLETRAQFQPVTDNITVWKEYVYACPLLLASLRDHSNLCPPSFVRQTKRGQTARIPLLLGTNKVSCVS